MFARFFATKVAATPAATGALAAGKAKPKATPKAKASPKSKVDLVSGTILDGTKLFELRKAAIASHVGNADASKTAAMRTYDYTKALQARFGQGFTKISKAKNAVLNDNEKAIIKDVKGEYFACIEETGLAWNENAKYAIWAMVKAFDTGKLPSPYVEATKAKRDQADPKTYDAKAAYVKAMKPVYRALQRKLNSKTKASAADLALGLEIGNRLKAFGVDLATLNVTSK
jgi:hypothetical protein